ncbi:MAG TPA: hypothetical protein VGD96_10830 [Bradyrhizobium sp.]
MSLGILCARISAIFGVCLGDIELFSGRADIALPPPALSLLPVACESILPVASEGSNDMSFASFIIGTAERVPLPDPSECNAKIDAIFADGQQVLELGCGSLSLWVAWQFFRVRGSRRCRIRTRSTSVSRLTRRSAAHRARLACQFRCRSRGDRAGSGTIRAFGCLVEQSTGGKLTFG